MQPRILDGSIWRLKFSNTSPFLSTLDVVSQIQNQLNYEIILQVSYTDLQIRIANTQINTVPLFEPCDFFVIEAESRDRTRQLSAHVLFFQA